MASSCCFYMPSRYVIRNVEKIYTDLHLFRVRYRSKKLHLNLIGRVLNSPSRSGHHAFPDFLEPRFWTRTGNCPVPRPIGRSKSEIAQVLEAVPQRELHHTRTRQSLRIPDRERRRYSSAGQLHRASMDCPRN
jgi:hypothetical protein